jgi:hypothetical protein
VTANARSAEAVDGAYKFGFLSADKPVLWIVKFETKNGKLAGEVLAKSRRVPDSSLDDLTVKDDLIHFIIKVKGPQGEEKVTFDGKVNPKDPKKVLGSVRLGPQIGPASLEQTQLTSLDDYEVAKEKIADTSGPEVFSLALTLLSQASAKKAKPEEVRSWASKAAKASESYGPLWQREVSLNLAEALTKAGDDLAKEALPYARQAERLLTADDKVSTQKRVLSTLATALAKAGKEEDAKDVEARIAKIAPPKFAGRKSQSDRVVLVELFTGAECPPCVAADMAFDRLGKDFKPKDVVLLQYHLHIPGPDPLANAGTEKRQSYYGDDIEGTPTIFFNGKAGPQGGGKADDALEKFEEYVEAVLPLLEPETDLKLKLSATQKGERVDITAETSDLKKPGEKIKLRLALVEDQVNYTGGNKVAHHMSVVRYFPGGEDGMALTEKTGKQTVSVDLDDVRKKLKKYLTEYEKAVPFPKEDKPLDLKKLRVVAFVQNDATREVLQAAQVDLTPEKAE